MAEHEFKIGDEVWVRGKIDSVDSEDARQPCRVSVLSGGYTDTEEIWPNASVIHPAPPAATSHKPFMAKLKPDGSWVAAPAGLRSDKTLAVHLATPNHQAEAIPAIWRPVFEAEPARFDLVDVEPETPESIAIDFIGKVAMGSTIHSAAAAGVLDRISKMKEAAKA